MIWRLFNRKIGSRPEQPRSLRLDFSESEKMRQFFREDELEKSVAVTEAFIIESVTPERSRDPVFRDDFFYLCRRLREHEHPSIPRLVDFGEENGRLYRAWERRPLEQFLHRIALRLPEERFLVQSLLDLLDGFLHMRELGLPLTPELLHSLSLDSKGCFLGRVPLTLKSGFYQGDFYKFRFSVNSLCPDNLKAFRENSPPVSPDVVFQFSLGTMLWVVWSDRFPYCEPPASASLGPYRPERHPFDFGSALTPVLNRLTELDSGKRFPTLEDALNALRQGLEQYRQS